MSATSRVVGVLNGTAAKATLSIQLDWGVSPMADIEKTDFEALAWALVNEAREKLQQLDVLPPERPPAATRQSLENDSRMLRAQMEMLSRELAALSASDHKGQDEYRHKVRQYSAQLQAHLDRLRVYIAKG